MGRLTIQNSLFGGMTTKPRQKTEYEVTLQSSQTNKSIKVKLMNEHVLCGGTPSIPNGPWIGELEDRNINLSDTHNDSNQIQILIGSDLLGTLITGRIYKTTAGLTAMETVLGWTLSGMLPKGNNISNTAVARFMGDDTSLQKLWSLEAIGITDPIKTTSKDEDEVQAFKHFRENVTTDDDGRYIVAWKDPSFTPPTNRGVAEKRLNRATQVLKDKGQFEMYNAIFTGWEKEGIIKEIIEDKDEGHYLPHRPVFGDSTTTPVRPVFDVSCKVKQFPSLNDCLYKGPNLLELIPQLLLRFRENEKGISADIRKAFQIIKVMEGDQKFQKFLWWIDDACTKMKVYQYLRVVFGMN